MKDKEKKYWRNLIGRYWIGLDYKITITQEELDKIMSLNIKEGRKFAKELNKKYGASDTNNS